MKWRNHVVPVYVASLTVVVSGCYLVSSVIWLLVDSIIAVITIYRQTRKFMQGIIKPGIKLFDMCETLEETARTLVEANGLTAGELDTNC